MIFKVLPSKVIPVINAGHEEYTSKKGDGWGCGEPGDGVSPSPRPWRKWVSALGMTLADEEVLEECVVVAWVFF